jgi:flagellar FliJ protein
MKRYKFPLESLRMLREQKEQASQQRHAKALAACRMAEEQLQVAAFRLAEAREWLSLVLTDKSAAEKIMNVRTWCAALEISHRERMVAVFDARRTAEQTLQEMTAATRDREGLDRFRDKSRRAYEYELRREEQKESDEMASQTERMSGLLEFAGKESFSHA